MKKRRTLKEKVCLRIKKSSSIVFLYEDLKDLGGRDQILRALRQLIKDGLLVKIGYGLYAEGEKSVLTGKIIPKESLSDLAKEALQKLNIKVEPTKLERLYMDGKSVQVPTGNVVGIVKSRISRKIGLNGNYITYERVA